MSSNSLISILALLLLSCEEAQVSVDAKGTLAGGHYSNDLLGFSLDLPAEWDTISEERYYNNQDWNTVLDSSIEGWKKIPYKFTPLIIVERGVLADSSYSAIAIITEDISVVGSTGKYLKHMEDLVSTDSTRLFPKWEFSEIHPPYTVGGKEFLSQLQVVWSSSDEIADARIICCREIGAKLLVVAITDCQSQGAMDEAKELLAAVKWNNELERDAEDRKPPRPHRREGDLERVEP